MAGSLSHIVDGQGRFTMSLIENMGDAEEALSECFEVIRLLSGGHRGPINVCLGAIGPNEGLGIDVDLKAHGG